VLADCEHLVDVEVASPSALENVASFIYILPWARFQRRAEAGAVLGFFDECFMLYAPASWRDAALGGGI